VSFLIFVSFVVKSLSNASASRIRSTMKTITSQPAIRGN